MAKQLTCSQCKTSLTVPQEMLGKWVRCPTCHESFLAAESSFLPPLDLEAVKPGKPPLLSPPRQLLAGSEASPESSSTYLQIVRQTLDERERQQAWSRVRDGLNVMHLGLLVAGVSLLGWSLITLAEILFLDLLIPKLFGEGWLPPSDYHDFVLWSLCLAAGVGTIIYVYGVCVCQLNQDNEVLAHSGDVDKLTSRALIYQLMFLTMFVLLGFAMYFDQGVWLKHKWSDFAGVAIYTGPSLLFVLGGILCLCKHLRRIAERFGNRSLAENNAKFVAFHVSWLSMLFVLLTINILYANEFCLALLHNNDPPIAGLVIWLLLLGVFGAGGGVVSLIWTLKLLRRTWESIPLKRPESQPVSSDP